MNRVVIGEHDYTITCCSIIESNAQEQLWLGGRGGGGSETLQAVYSFSHEAICCVEEHGNLLLLEDEETCEAGSSCVRR